MVSKDTTRLARVLFAVILTGILAFALYWGFLRDNRAESGAGMRIELDFTSLPDGPAPTQFDTGQPTLLSQSPSDPGSSFVVRNGALTYKPTTPDTTAAYLSTPDMGAPVSSIGARWVFQPSEGTNGSIALAVSRGVQKSIPQPVPPIPIHFVVTATDWHLSVLQKPGSTPDIIAQGSFNQPLTEDSTTSYEVSLYMDGGQVSVTLPDGTKKIVKDARISEWRGNYATFEAYSNNGLTDSIGAFQQVWADSTGNE